MRKQKNEFQIEAGFSKRFDMIRYLANHNCDDLKHCPECPRIQKVDCGGSPQKESSAHSCIVCGRLSVWLNRSGQRGLVNRSESVPRALLAPLYETTVVRHDSTARSTRSSLP